MKTVFKKGDIVQFSKGCYDSYYVYPPMIALQNFRLKDQVKEWLGMFPNQKDEYCFETDHFINWLVEVSEVLSPVDYAEVHISDYNTLAKNLLPKS